MNNPYYAVKQATSSRYDGTEYSMDVLARFDYEEDAKKLVEAKQIAHELEMKATSEKSPVKYNYFIVWREN